MSSLAYPDPNKTPPDPQIWRTNAAFDNGDPLHHPIDHKDSWFHSNPIDPIKENKTPIAPKSLISAKSPRSEGKPLKLLFKQGIRCPLDTQFENETEEEEEECDDVSKIDDEIQEIEKEISRLSSKVEALRVKKAEKEAKVVVNRKRKFLGMDLKEKVERSITIPSRQSRRKSCFPTLQDQRSLGDARLKKPPLLNIQEFDTDKVTTQRGGRSLSLSPKSRKIHASKRGSTTLGPNKSAKDNAVVSSLQPKKLFDGRKSVGSTKPIQNGRVIASRYSQITSRRKWSLPSEGNVEKCDKKCSPLVENSRGFLQDLDLNQGPGTRRVKKRWEIPSEVVIHESKGDSAPPPPSFSKMVGVLPKIKTNRLAKGSPRDSGPAKRVVELVGRKSYFGIESREANSSVCQALCFDGDK